MAEFCIRKDHGTWASVFPVSSLLSVSCHRTAPPGPSTLLGVSPASPPREMQGMEEQEAPGHKLATHLKVDAVADPRCVIMARSGHVELHGHIVFDVH